MSRSGFPLITFLALTLFLAAACSGAAAPTTAPIGRLVTEAPDNEPGDNANPEAPVLPDQQLIVYTGSLELDVTDLDSAVQQAEQLINGLGGHVASSRAEDAGDYQYATVTYRIPSQNWQEALAGFGHSPSAS